MWKERLWQVFLVAILGLTLTMCSRSSSNNTTSSTGTLNADGTSTVIVSSLPTITLANVGPNAISHTMFCMQMVQYGAIIRYAYCDASDDTTLSSYSTATSSSSGTTYTNSITHDEAFTAGWKLVGPGCSSGSTSNKCFLFHK